MACNVWYGIAYPFPIVAIEVGDYAVEVAEGISNFILHITRGVYTYLCQCKKILRFAVMAKRLNFLCMMINCAHKHIFDVLSRSFYKTIDQWNEMKSFSIHLCLILSSQLCHSLATRKYLFLFTQKGWINILQFGQAESVRLGTSWAF